MIDIKLEGGYRIYTQDDYSVILSRMIPIFNTKSKNYGQVREKIVGYFGNLRQALAGFAKHRMADDDTHLTGSVDAIIAELEKLEVTINSVAQKVSEQYENSK